ncbi:hypothetical protein YSY43_20290 [Paenibacillus sp. YSY-4.3]
MKKADWIIASLFMAIGLLCLTVSASYYRADRGLGMFKSACLWMALAGAGIYLGYRILRCMLGRGKKK